MIRSPRPRTTEAWNLWHLGFPDQGCAQDRGQSALDAGGQPPQYDRPRPVLRGQHPEHVATAATRLRCRSGGAALCRRQLGGSLARFALSISAGRCRSGARRRALTRSRRCREAHQLGAGRLEPLPSLASPPKPVPAPAGMTKPGRASAGRSRRLLMAATWPTPPAPSRAGGVVAGQRRGRARRPRGGPPRRAEHRAPAGSSVARAACGSRPTSMWAERDERPPGSRSPVCWRLHWGFAGGRPGGQVATRRAAPDNAFRNRLLGRRRAAHSACARVGRLRSGTGRTTSAPTASASGSPRATGGESGGSPAPHRIRSRRNSSCCLVSTPSATTRLPSAWPSSIIDLMMISSFRF